MYFAYYYVLSSKQKRNRVTKKINELRKKLKQII